MDGGARQVLGECLLAQLQRSGQFGGKAVGNERGRVLAHERRDHDAAS